MGRVPHVGSVERRLREPPDGEHASPAGELARERHAGLDLAARRRAIRGRGAGVRRHDVPEEHGVGEPELGQRAVDDGRRRLGWSRAGQLALGSERDAGDARAAVAGCLADEQQRCFRPGVEVVVEALGEPLVAVLIERVADARSGEPLYQRSQCTTSSSARRR
jgi:hypothetical protein